MNTTAGKTHMVGVYLRHWFWAVPSQPIFGVMTSKPFVSHPYFDEVGVPDEVRLKLYELQKKFEDLTPDQRHYTQEKVEAAANFTEQVTAFECALDQTMKSIELRESFGFGDGLFPAMYKKLSDFNLSGTDAAISMKTGGDGMMTKILDQTENPSEKKYLQNVFSLANRGVDFIDFLDQNRSKIEQMKQDLERWDQEKKSIPQNKDFLLPPYYCLAAIADMPDANEELSKYIKEYKDLCKVFFNRDFFAVSKVGKVDISKRGVHEYFSKMAAKTTTPEEKMALEQRFHLIPKKNEEAQDQSVGGGKRKNEDQAPPSSGPPQKNRARGTAGAAPAGADSVGVALAGADSAGAARTNGFMWGANFGGGSVVFGGGGANRRLVCNPNSAPSGMPGLSLRNHGSIPGEEDSASQGGKQD